MTLNTIMTMREKIARVGGTRVGFLAVLTSLTILACVAGSVAGVDEQPLGPGTHDLSLEVGDRERTYYLHLPPPLGGATPLPLLLAFHGGGGRASGYRDYAGLDAVAEREGFAVAYPDGTGRLGRRLLTWNAGGCCGAAMREGVDDVAFARALVEEIGRRVPIDRRRVYATGHSNGAMMAYRVAAEAPDLVAAIAPVAGAMSLDPFEATVPMPVLHVHSVDDPRALYAGGLGPPFPLTRVRVHHNAVEPELARWIALDGCPSEPAVVAERIEESTGHTATHLRFAPCESRAEVELWKLSGAGHGWPGSGPTGRERLVGPNTKVIDAAEEVWRFVSRFEKAASE
jgi:polyhydroxybutyrate depolymerase